jgi:hypothetical protein
MDNSNPPDPALVTYSGVAGTLTAWGLKVPDIIALASLLVALAGLLAQIYYVWLVRRSMHKDKPPPPV